MLKETLSKFFKVDSLLSNLTGYFEARVELIKVELKEDLSKGLARGVSYLGIAFFFALMLTFLSIAAALLIGKSLGVIAGFGIVGLVYLIFGFILWFNRTKLIAKMEALFGAMFKKKNGDL